MNILPCKSFQFKFITADEARKTARRVINDGISTDLTGKPTQNGLYDRLLGTCEENAVCITCKLIHKKCPGHYGIIEFSKPIFNPFTFNDLIKLLKGICLYCYSFNLSNESTECFAALGYKSGQPLLNFSKFHQFKSLSTYDLIEKMKKLMASQPRRPCKHCQKKAIIFKKKRKGEIVAKITQKEMKKGLEPPAKRRKLNKNDNEKTAEEGRTCTYLSKYSMEDMQGVFGAIENVVLPDVLREILRCVWSKEKQGLSLIFPFLDNYNSEYPTDAFFMENMLVSPNNARIPQKMCGLLKEHPDTTNLCQVVKQSNILHKFVSENPEITVQLNVDSDRYQLECELLYCLQQRVNNIYDSNMHPTLRSHPGLRQTTDKKKGVIRTNIMGKRVNFCCRSVISPDPNIGLDEIGVPQIFLKRLTFPEVLTQYNKKWLLKCVLNGQNKYPGAVEYKLGLDPETYAVRIRGNLEAVAAKLDAKMQMGEIVTIQRHANSSDFLVMNRQPTLHRPSMQGHRIHVLSDPKAKTLRMHYSNCKAYNADFDGDEMNGHLPQSLMAKSEQQNLMATSLQYSAPKDGSLLAGLIQDHIIGGTKVCLRNQWFNIRDYQMLVLHGLRDRYEPPLCFLEPAIIKPMKLWTGKQVISTIILNTLPRGSSPPNMQYDEPEKQKLWEPRSSSVANFREYDLCIIDGDVCTGIFDKVHLGPSARGFLADMRELYGSNMAINVLTAISRMLNHVITHTGFSVTYEDALLTPEFNCQRKKMLKNVDALGFAAYKKAFDMNDDCSIEDLVSMVQRTIFDKSDQYQFMAGVSEITFKQMCKSYSDNIISLCEHNLLKPFPDNNFSMMLLTGAKGSDANIQKMAHMIGSIEVEGNRCPYNITGRTLPSYMPYDTRPVSRGFIENRYSTGITDKDILFDSRAGRDGLVDTAVKTSISGYLQRCLIKQLEDLVVAYDGTVRDSGNNIIQFKYGHDGQDVVEAFSLRSEESLEVYVRNHHHFKNRRNSKTLSLELPDNLKARVERVVERLSSLEPWLNIDVDTKNSILQAVTCKYYSSMVAAGEPVGILAAQSIGEPSTQMTLNTFHSAGQSDMNVTLGIPRLKEILVMGGENIKTPSMEVPLKPGVRVAIKARMLQKRVYRLSLKEVLNLPIEMEMDSNYMYVKLRIKPRIEYVQLTNKTEENIAKYLTTAFLTKLAKLISKELENEEVCGEMDKPIMYEDEDIQGDVEDVEDNEGATEKVGKRKEREMSDDEETDDDEDEEKCNNVIGDDDEEEEKEELEDLETDDEDQKKEEDVEVDDNDVEIDVDTQFFKSCKFNPKRRLVKIKMINYSGVMDIKNLIDKVINHSCVSEIRGIKRAFIKEGIFIVDGYNAEVIADNCDLFDMTRFYSNNLLNMYKRFGIRASARIMEMEILAVFKPYKIDVDRRHLRLVCDYLTRTGYVCAFNRHKMKNHPSMIQRATFETALTVFNEMALHGTSENMLSPSASVMFAQTPRIGTNYFELIDEAAKQ